MIINKQFYFYGDATHTEATQGNLGLSKKKNRTQADTDHFR